MHCQIWVKTQGVDVYVQLVPTSTPWKCLPQGITSFTSGQPGQQRAEQSERSVCRASVKKKAWCCAVVQKKQLGNIVFSDRCGKFVFSLSAWGRCSRACQFWHFPVVMYAHSLRWGVWSSDSSAWAAHTVLMLLCFSQDCFMEARHCLAAASVIFSQAGQVPSAEDGKFIKRLWTKSLWIKHHYVLVFKTEV